MSGLIGIGSVCAVLGVGGLIELLVNGRRRKDGTEDGPR